MVFVEKLRVLCFSQNILFLVFINNIYKHAAGKDPAVYTSETSTAAYALLYFSILYFQLKLN